MLIPIVLEKLPDDIKLESSRKLGTDKLKIDEFLELLKEERVAGEGCLYMKTQDHSAYRHQTNKPNHFTTDSLFAGSHVL